MDLPPPIPDSLLSALLAPSLSSLSSLAADLNTTPADLANLLSSPELTDKLAAIITNLEALEHLRALAARAPATATCRALLTTADPIEQRRVAATLLRTPIHRPLHSSTHQRARRTSDRMDSHRPAQTQFAHTLNQAAPAAPRPQTPDHPAHATRDLESLLSLLLTPTPDAVPSPTPPPTRAPGGMLAALGKHVPPVEPTAPAPARPGTPAPPLNLPQAPTLHRRTPPSRAASLLSAAASTPSPHPRPP